MKALIFDLDGTLVDSVYAHTLAWQKSLSEFGMQSPAWTIHRRIGMSGKLLVKAIAREQHRALKRLRDRKVGQASSAAVSRTRSTCAPLPGAVELLIYLARSKIAHGIATSGRRDRD